MTAEPCRAKAKPFTPSSILVRPHQMPPRASRLCLTCLPTLLERYGRRHLVEAPGTAPGSERLITTAFIAIAGRIRHHEYSGSRGENKAVRSPHITRTLSPPVRRGGWRHGKAASPTSIVRATQASLEAQDHARRSAEG